ncbi:alpha/beta fold hydrolase BchO [Primorskyibacter sp. 2E107]|uniref:alpha/beta fold hydrolase BchO n=1 Tax=Primorskyibacter sp. 2E107 TaxID=3403458 RepID=UPI003AF81914
MDWTRDLPSWPHAALSRRVLCRPHQWHVQETGSGPTVLLLHGAGASTHSWRDLIPSLADHFHVVALDLPGQGFSRLGARNRCGLEKMSADIGTLCADQGWAPALIIGHSAGAAIALNLSLILPDAPKVIGINAALGRFDGIAGWLFPVLAKVLALTPLTALAFSSGSDPMARARRLIESTGSQLDEHGLGFYARLISNRDHVDGALKMMAQWSVDALLDRLTDIPAPCLLLTGEKDSAVQPAVSAGASRRLRTAEVVTLSDLGHLAHEEDPDRVLRCILDWTGGRRGL